MSDKMTNYPAFPFVGKFYSEQEIRAIEKRAARRATHDGTVPEEPIRQRPMKAVSRDTVPARKAGKVAASRVCAGCGGPLGLPVATLTDDRRKYCSSDCRRRADVARAKARRHAERMAG